MVSVVIKNNGTSTLHKLKIILEVPSVIKFNVTPKEYPELNTGEGRLFILDLLSTESGTFYSNIIITNEITKTKRIKIIVIEKKPPINETELKLRIKSLENVIQKTVEILSQMLNLNYNVTDLLNYTSEISNNIEKAKLLLERGEFEGVQKILTASEQDLKKVVNEIAIRGKERETIFKLISSNIFIIALLITSTKVLTYTLAVAFVSFTLTAYVSTGILVRRATVIIIAPTSNKHIASTIFINKFPFP
mgnify:CR=1 FL=1